MLRDLFYHAWMLAGLPLAWLIVGCGQTSPARTLGDDAVAATTDGDLVFAQTVDHFAGQAATGDASPTFAQRYFVGEQYASSLPTRPVLLLICGEGPCSQELMQKRLSHWAKPWQASMLALEHRYYGKSFPVPDLSISNLRYLSTAQALADIERFLWHWRAAAGHVGPVIVIGGSYAGTLAAYARAAYPELIAAAWAASAPVRASLDISAFDLKAAAALPPACAAAYRQFLGSTDKLLSDGGSAYEQLLDDLGMTGELRPDVTGVAQWLAAPLGEFAQYGLSSEAFCQAAQAANPEPALRGYYREYFLQRAAVEPAVEVHPYALPPEETYGGRAFAYQMCSEYGFFATASSDRERSVYSRLLSVDAVQSSVCAEFPEIAGPPNTNVINDTYYASLLRPAASKILYTYAETDPWSALAMRPSPELTPDQLNLIVTMPDGRHQAELRAPRAGDSDGLLRARAAFHNLVQALLPAAD